MVSNQGKCNNLSQNLLNAFSASSQSPVFGEKIDYNYGLWCVAPVPQVKFCRGLVPCHLNCKKKTARASYVYLASHLGCLSTLTLSPFPSQKKDVCKNIMQCRLCRQCGKIGGCRERCLTSRGWGGGGGGGTKKII